VHAALHAAGIPSPYLLVGRSFGSYNARVLADLYMPEVYGLVLDKAVANRYLSGRFAQ